MALLLPAEALATSHRPTFAVVCGGLTLAADVVGLLYLIGVGQPTDLGLAAWKSGPWTLLWYSIIFGITAVTWGHPQSGIAAEIAISNFLRALSLVAVGLTAWAIGYRIGPGQLARGLVTRALSALGYRFADEVRSMATRARRQE